MLTSLHTLTCKLLPVRTDTHAQDQRCDIRPYRTFVRMRAPLDTGFRPLMSFSDLKQDAILESGSYIVCNLTYSEGDSIELGRGRGVRKNRPVRSIRQFISSWPDYVHKLAFLRRVRCCVQAGGSDQQRWWISILFFFIRNLCQSAFNGTG